MRVHAKMSCRAPRRTRPSPRCRRHREAKMASPHRHYAVDGHRRPADRRCSKRESSAASGFRRRQSSAAECQRGHGDASEQHRGGRKCLGEQAAVVLTRRSSTESSRLSGARSSRRPGPAARKSVPATSGREVRPARVAEITRLGFMPPRPILLGSASPPARAGRLRSRAKNLPACPARQVLRASSR